MRYQRTVIGMLWALIRLVLTIAIFTILFGKLAKLPSLIACPVLVARDPALVIPCHCHERGEQ